LFQDEGFFDDNAAVVFDHEGCQFGAVNEDKACIDAFGVVAGVGAETRRDEHSAAGLGAAECPDEGLDVRAADVPVGVALWPGRRPTSTALHAGFRLPPRSRGTGPRLSADEIASTLTGGPPFPDARLPQCGGYPPA
jgi:hypothetical protein